ncbi:family 43 glycosylhydrolase [Arthrobacter sp. UC242_113]|uniref:family 43 glycosylhydrolase n=1 Tax=Arthrobacter sp. UC242_113 TaxID=3374550 RepID=UPI003756FF01
MTAAGVDQSTAAQGVEGQRIAGQGDGTYLNPVFSGDRPDPAILRDGDDYYLTFSSFEAAPGLMIWHSRDLLNWAPIGPALRQPIGSVFAVDMCKHEGRYYIYIPVIPTAVSPDPRQQIYVIHAPDMRGPWSDPAPVGIFDQIDPGHVVGEDGKRYLFTNGMSRVRLTDDGLSVDGPKEHVYDGWKYPDDWVTEAYALEGPKLVRRGKWFYLTSAVGGTSGPPTGHMVTVARSHSVHGPWEDCPDNPIVRTWDAKEKWWSRGHATLFEGPGGRWWMIYHGYENGYLTLGRQTLLEPVEWTEDGWPVAQGGDLSVPLKAPLDRIPGQDPAIHGIALSDDFKEPRFGTQWTFHAPAADEYARASFGDGLLLQGRGSSPADSSPLTCLVGDHSYEVTVQVELLGDAVGGLLLYYSNRLFAGLGFNEERIFTYRAGRDLHYWRKEPAPETRNLHLRIVNNANILTLFYSRDGIAWTRHGLRSEVSGYNTNTADELLSLRPALFATGTGRVRFRNFQYRALED